MSGAEATAVLGVISSVIAIVEAVQKTYDASKDAQRIHKAFRDVSECIPIILGILRDAETIQAQAVNDLGHSDDIVRKQSIMDISREVGPIMNSCKTNVEALEKIFQQAVPKTGASWHRRCTKSIQTVLPSRQRKVGQLLKDTMEKLQLLHYYHSFKNMPSLGQLRSAIKHLAGSSSLPLDLVPLGTDNRSAVLNIRSPPDTSRIHRPRTNSDERDFADEGGFAEEGMVPPNKAERTNQWNSWLNSDGTKVVFQGGVHHNAGVQNFTL